MENSATKVRFNDEVRYKNSSREETNQPEPDFTDKQAEELGYYLLRKNYKRVKPHSKYAEEGIRPRSPNVPYSFMSDTIIKNNPKSAESIFHETVKPEDNLPKVKRHFLDRSTDTFNEHLIRGISASQPYGFIAKEAHNRFLPPEYTASRAGAYPTWGPAETGFRTRSHYVAEPAEKFMNIDMYKRPLTNQPGNIIFDHGRPNNGYYLQRNQYDNTWFNTTLKLNRTDILKNIQPKTKAEYTSLDELRKTLTRSKTLNWPFVSEYTDKFELNSNN